MNPGNFMNQRKPYRTNNKDGNKMRFQETMKGNCISYILYKFMNTRKHDKPIQEQFTKQLR